jgi:hypothetical protein
MNIETAFGRLILKSLALDLLNLLFNVYIFIGQVMDWFEIKYEFMD